MLARRDGRTYLISDQRYKRVNIQSNEIPFLISNDGFLVCIPIGKDMPIIGITASRRVGKTITLHSFKDRVYWYTNTGCIFISDYQNETKNYHLPNDSFLLELLKITKEKPIGLPKIHIYPNTNSLKEENLPPDSIKTSLPVLELIKYPESYFELKNSAMYLRNLYPKFEEINKNEGTISMEDIENVINEHLAGNSMDKKVREGFENLKTKIIESFKDIASDGSLDIDLDLKERFGRVTTYLNVKKDGKEYWDYIFVGLVRAGLFPIFMTEDLLQKRKWENYISFIVNKIFNSIKNDKELKEKGLLLFIDEMERIFKKSRKKNAQRSIAGDSFVNIAKIGGPNRVGMIYTNLNYSELDDELISNTKYMIVLQHTSDKEVKLIQKDFTFEKRYVQTILNLKKLEAMAFTKEKFVKYNLITGEKVTDTEPVIGRILPPLSYPQPPGD